ncbi:MAG: TIGR02679 family protein [Kibdelosporangium sp.]
MRQLPSALMPLWRAVHARLSSGRPVSRVRVGPLDDDQQAALADLLGMQRLPGEHATVSLAQLDEVLLSAVGAGTREVVAEFVGPIGDAARDRASAAAERADLRTWLETQRVVRAQPALLDWVSTIKMIDGSVPRTKAELDRVFRVLGELPASGEPLPVFADNVLNDTHALDEGTRTAGMVLRALTAIYGVDAPTDTHDRRALWERAGIADDELSSTVLAAGLRPEGADVASRILRACADSGHAAALTLSQIRDSRRISGPGRVWVVENPSMLALALARFGPRCPPMVCLSGWPSAAGVLLLRKLHSRLYYHGDFDGEGLRIAAHVMARTGATPWRMNSADYLGAVADGPPVGRVTPAPWDPGLAETLLRVGVSVSEERVSGALLAELDEIVGGVG